MLFVKLRQAPFEITRAFLSLASAQGEEEEWGGEGRAGLRETSRGRTLCGHVQKWMGRPRKQDYKRALRQPAAVADSRENTTWYLLNFPSHQQLFREAWPGRHLMRCAPFPHTIKEKVRSEARHITRAQRTPGEVHTALCWLFLTEPELCCPVFRHYPPVATEHLERSWTGKCCKCKIHT